MQNEPLHIKDILHRSHPEIAILIKSMATYYPNMVRVYLPNVPIKKLPEGWETDDTLRIGGFRPVKSSSESPEDRSIRRSQRRVKDYVLCNSFDLFATITIASDRHNIERSKRKLTTWLKHQRDRNGKFSYVIVPEYHKDGALHFHGVFKGYTGVLKQSKSAKTNRPLSSNGKDVYEFLEYKSGFTKVQYIGKTPDDLVRVGNYIRKYITKEMVSIFGKKRYWTSQGLRKPIIEYNPAWLSDIEPDLVFENEYGKFYTFTNLWEKIVPDEFTIHRSQQDK